jgi:hypothetical protein
MFHRGPVGPTVKHRKVPPNLRPGETFRCVYQIGVKCFTGAEDLRPGKTFTGHLGDGETFPSARVKCFTADSLRDGETFFVSPGRRWFKRRQTRRLRPGETFLVSPGRGWNLT